MTKIIHFLAQKNKCYLAKYRELKAYSDKRRLVIVVKDIFSSRVRQLCTQGREK